MAFSISACTREPRPGEQDGRDYYFLTEASFKEKIAAEAFIEWEMVYTGKYYGTLKSEVDRIWAENRAPLVDIDVQGALNIKSLLGDKAVTLFIKAPSMEELEKRLRARGTESAQNLQERLDKAADELTFADRFDHVVVNDNLEQAITDTLNIITSFLKEPEQKSKAIV